MAEVLDQQQAGPEVLSKLQELEQREARFFQAGEARRQELSAIKAAKLHEAAGFKWFGTYCRVRLKLEKQEVSRILSGERVVIELNRRQIADSSVIKPSHLRAVEGMNPGKAAEVIEKAIELAPKDRNDRPRLTARRIEDQARQAGFVPRREFVERKKAERKAEKEGRTPDPFTTAPDVAGFIRKRLEAAFGTIVSTGYTTAEILEHLGGSAYGLENFAEALQKMQDLSTGSE